MQSPNFYLTINIITNSIYMGNWYHLQRLGLFFDVDLKWKEIYNFPYVLHVYCTLILKVYFLDQYYLIIYSTLHILFSTKFSTETWLNTGSPFDITFLVKMLKLLDSSDCAKKCLCRKLLSICHSKLMMTHFSQYSCMLNTFLNLLCQLVAFRFIFVIFIIL